MTNSNDTIRILIPLNVRKKNGRPKILPPADHGPSADQAQDPHILRAIGRAWAWRRRMEAGEFATIQELAEAVGLAERHVSRQLRLAYLAPEVLKRLTFGQEASAVIVVSFSGWLRGWKTTAVMCLAVRAAVVGSERAGSVRAHARGYPSTYGKRGQTCRLASPYVVWGFHT